MKEFPKILLALMFLCSGVNAFAQKDTLYYNSQWKQTDKQNASYYRQYVRQDGAYLVDDHYKNGTLQMTGAYTWLDTPDEKYRNGDFVYYYPDGLKESEGRYNLGNRAGKWTYYYNSDSSLHYTAEYINDKKNGYAVYYDSATQMIRSQGVWINEKKVGIWTYYFHGTKNIKELVEYKKDPADSYITSFDSIYHTVVAKGPIIKNKQADRWTFYFRNSKNIKSIITFLDGKQTGPAMFYDSNTHNLSIEGLFISGLRFGKWIYYDENGKVKEWRTVGELPLLIEYVKHFDTSYITTSEGELLHQRMSGLWKFYNDKGKLQYTGNYQYGMLEGEFKEFSVGGVVIRREYYSSGKMLKGKCYNEAGNVVLYHPLKEYSLPSFNEKD